MLRPSKQYTKTQLIRMHITWSDLADACTCGDTSAHSRAAHPELCVTSVTMNQFPHTQD